MVEQFKMSTPVYTHDMAKALKHTLTAGEREREREREKELELEKRESLIFKQSLLILLIVGTQDGLVTICDINSGSSSHILKRHKKPVMCLQWSPSEEYMLATGRYVYMCVCTCRQLVY